MPVEYLLTSLWRWISEVGIALAIVVVCAMLVPRLGRFLIRFIESKLINYGSSEAKTHLALVGTAVYLGQILVYALLLITALKILGFTTTGIAIPATVISAALGFGAQSIIADFLAGFFILTERQFGLGDWVRFQGNGIDVQGDVMKITMRAVHMRTLAGETVIIPNSTARVCINHSNNWARAVVVIPIPLLGSESMADVVERCVAAGKRALADPIVADDITGELEVHPPVDITQPTAVGQPWMVNMRFLVRTYPLCQWAVERTLRTYIVDEFWADYGSATTAEGYMRTSLEDAPEVPVLDGAYAKDPSVNFALADSQRGASPVVVSPVSGAKNLTSGEKSTGDDDHSPEHLKELSEAMAATQLGERDDEELSVYSRGARANKQRARSAAKALQAAAGKHSPDKSPMGTGGRERQPKNTPPDMGPGAGIALIRPELFKADGTPEDTSDTTWFAFPGRKKEVGTGVLSLGGRVRNSTTLLLLALFGLFMLQGLTFTSDSSAARGVWAPPPREAYVPATPTPQAPASSTPVAPAPQKQQQSSVSSTTTRPGAGNNQDKKQDPTPAPNSDATTNEGDGTATTPQNPDQQPGENPPAATTGEGSGPSNTTGGGAGSTPEVDGGSAQQPGDQPATGNNSGTATTGGAGATTRPDAAGAASNQQNPTTN